MNTRSEVAIMVLAEVMYGQLAGDGTGRGKEGGFSAGPLCQVIFGGVVDIEGEGSESGAAVVGTELVEPIGEEG